MSSQKEKTTSVLSISSPYISSTCLGVAEMLRQMGIPASVTPNHSIIKSQEPNKPASLEYGCQITLGNDIAPGSIPKKVWLPLKENFKLTCAHLHVHGQFRGCIYDYDRKSECPGGDPHEN